MNANAASLSPDSLFHRRYRILRCLKAGGMGAIYEVFDEATASRRALKVMLPGLMSSDELRARFALEARITGSIESDHIVRTLDAGVDPDTETPFLVMELLRGEELGSLLRKRGALPPEDVALYLFQASLALDRTHAAGIVHRDLKPDNLFVTIRDDGTPCVKILDFGIAKVFEQRNAAVTQHMLGTPVYMAPEQIRADRNVGPRADVHALGHVAYTLLVGESYWCEEADSLTSPYLLAAEILRGPMERASIRARRRRNRALPEAFDAWFSKATALKSEDRFEGASDAVAELADALEVMLPRLSRVVLVPDSFPPPTEMRAALTSARSDAPFDPTILGTPQPASSTSSAATPETPLTPPRPPPASRGNRPVDPPPFESGQRPTPPSRATAAAQPTPAEPKRSESSTSRRERLKQRRFDITADLTTGILRLKVWGFWDVAEGKAYLEEFLAKAAMLLDKPWYVLADISEFPAQKPEVNAFVEQTMAFATTNKVKKAANLVSSALTRMQISRLSADMGLPEFSFFTSEADAVSWLLRPD